MKALVLVVLLSLGGTGHADLVNNELLHTHVDRLVAQPHGDLFASHLTVTASALVPILGTYLLDEQVFGSVRPSAVVFDWVLGGVAPAALGAVALASHGEARAVTAWSALGLYVATRIGVIWIGNLHVAEYNRYVAIKLGPTGLSASW